MKQTNSTIKHLELKGNRIGLNGGEVSFYNCTVFIWCTCRLSSTERALHGEEWGSVTLIMGSSSKRNFAFPRTLKALVTALRTSTQRKENLILGMKECDTSHKDDMLFSSANPTGKYTLNLEVWYTLPSNPIAAPEKS